MIPVVKRMTKYDSETMDLFTYGFLEFRNIYLQGEITDDLATEIIVQLEYLDRTGKDDIHLYINSPGGSVTAGFAIMDAMNRCNCDVSTICTGMAASMGAFLLSCGKKGKRFITPMAEVMIHQPLGGARGQASDIELVANHIIKTKKCLNKILADNTGKSIETIAGDCDRDYYMSAGEALDYGLVDVIMLKNK